MARLSIILFMPIVVVIIGSFVSTSEGRKLLGIIDKQMVPSLGGRGFPGPIPDGTVTPPSPSKGGHGKITNKQLFVHHLSASHQILHSGPSPGAGH